MRLGKRPARRDSVKLKLANYIDKSVLPKPPASFGHEQGVQAWSMLGNDQYGDCVFAGGAHETMLWSTVGGKPAQFSDHSVLSDYAKVTGFDPSRPETDQGTDMQEAASYRRKTGLLDAHGHRHRIAAYVAITPGDLHEHLVALYLFGSVGIGIEFPASAVDQVNAGKPWTVRSRSPIEGGHYIPLVARRSSRFRCVTWGMVQPMSDGFFRKYNDESIAYVSEEMLVGGKSPEGFDAATLLRDLKAIEAAA